MGVKSNDPAPVDAPPPQLPYGTTPIARTSVLAWVALGFALIGAFVAATQVMIVLREATIRTRFEWVGSAPHLLLPVLAILLAALGWRRRAKRWSIVAIAIAVLSILAVLFLTSRTWGKPLPGGASPWHRPRFEWRG